MPCFKGLAVSIHTPDGPLPEYAIQRQSRLSRVNIFVPVPPPKLSSASDPTKPEQSTFAISITLLTPGLSVPYSTPKPSAELPYPRPQCVDDISSVIGERSRFSGGIRPYVPLTTSPNETVAAYIYFDGRAKEEVATLLRRGEETWVNSRWVGVPESEGGGLAEREFLFREVGLERWLNGLDLEGKDAAAKIERRRQKIERKRRKRREERGSDEDEAESSALGQRDRPEKGLLRYSTDSRRPLEHMSDSDGMLSSDTDSDDDPVPESAGQIKVALFRVLASGEIRRGEYSPQFDAHDDSTDMGGGNEDSEEVDHTTSFAQPKTLDPKSISTQTVTGIDPSDRPFAVFTFLYRGEKQLQKMGILPSSTKAQEKTPVSPERRRSMQTDLSKLKPLNPNGLKGFSQFRDPNERKLDDGGQSGKSGKKRHNEMDSDDEIEPSVEPKIKLEDGDNKDSTTMLSPEDARRQGELADGVQKIRLKRQHSSDILGSPSPAPAHRKSPPSNTPTAGSSPRHARQNSGSPPPLLPNVAFDTNTVSTSDVIGSPLKKQRASLQGVEDDGMRRRLGLGLSGVRADVLGTIEQANGGNGTGNEETIGPVAQDHTAFGGLLGKKPGAASATVDTEETTVKPEEMEDEDL